MKLLIASVLLIVIVGVLGDETYTDKYDNINLDEILANDRLTKKYVDCCIDKATCTKDGAELKSHVKEALQTGCAKCTDKQKAAVKKVLHYLTEKKPEWWKQLIDFYDPNGEYKEKYSSFLSQEGVKL